MTIETCEDWYRCVECDGEFDINDLDGDGLCEDCNARMSGDDEDDVSEYGAFGIPSTLVPNPRLADKGGS